MTSPQSKPAKVWQQGNCHCGAVSFEVLHEPLYASPDSLFHAPIISCNCSICLKSGYLLIYPERHEVKWLSGWDTMGTYRFATKTKDHRFCGTCGSSVLIDYLGNEDIGKFLGKSGDLLGINVRLIKDIDLERLNIDKMHGKDYGVPYTTSA